MSGRYYTNSKPIAGKISIFVGLMFVLFFICTTCFDRAFQKNAIETKATITSIDRYKSASGDYNYEVYVMFETNEGQQISTRLNQYVFTMDEGDTIKICYSKTDPYHIRPLEINLFSYVFLVFGLLFTLLGIFIHKIESAQDNEETNEETIV